MISETLLAQAKICIKQSIDRASAHFNAPFKCPEVNLQQRGKIAGSAHLQQNLIKLNKTLFEENHIVFMQEVIPHEVAHIVCFQRFGKVKPHGVEWKSIMRDVFELPPKVTHTLDVENVGLKQFEYVCDCRESVYLSSIRHNKVLRGSQQYRCRNCHRVLRRKT